jgi:Fe/S biogenesis protein NfuA
MSNTTKAPVEFTELARETVLGFLERNDGTPLSLRIRVASPSPLDPRYDITLIEHDERCEEDVVFDDPGFEVVMDPDSVQILDGARIDWIETLIESGFKVENPNLEPIGAKPLEGPLADRVQQAIDQYVNPGVAQHGGHVTLVDVRDDIVYLQMGGGCQGCGMASVTLSQGIEKILRDQVPEIAGIQDVTNHAAGDSPYITAEK